METAVAAFTAMPPLAIIAMLGYVIYMLVQNQQEVKTLKSNDLHELPEMHETLKDISRGVQELKVTQASEFSYIRARLNGKG